MYDARDTASFTARNKYLRHTYTYHIKMLIEIKNTEQDKRNGTEQDTRDTAYFTARNTYLRHTNTI